MNCGCNQQITVQPDCGCQPQVPSTPVTPTNCRQPLQPSELAQLVYVQGLDAANCVKYQQIATALGFIACDGSAVSPATPLVTCSLFRSTLCDTLSALSPNGVAGPTTKLVGADCQTYTLPATVVPLSVLDTDTLDLTLTGLQVLSGDVKVSSVAGNTLAVNADGLYVPTPPAGITVADTDCVNLDLTAGVITADLTLDDNACNAIQCGPEGLFVAKATSAGGMTEESTQLNQPLLVPVVVDLPLVTLDVVNPSDCLPAILSLGLTTPDLCTTGTKYQVKFELLVQFLLPGVNNGAEFILTVTNFSGTNDADAAYERGWTYTVPAAFSGSVTARVRVTLVSGSLSLVQVSAPKWRYHLSTI